MMEKDFLDNYQKYFRGHVKAYVNIMNDKIQKDEISLQVDPIAAFKGKFTYDPLFKIINSTNLLTEKEKKFMCKYVELTDTHHHLIYDILASTPAQLKKDIVFILWIIWEEYFLINQDMFNHPDEEGAIYARIKVI